MRKEKGKLAYELGRIAEGAVESAYTRAGREIIARRWRGPGGEIDLVARDGAEIIFIEVKASRTHAEAVQNLSARQMGRIYRSASAFLAGEPLGQLTPARFDVALVNAVGEIEILENAFAA